MNLLSDKNRTRQQEPHRSEKERKVLVAYRKLRHIVLSSEQRSMPTVWTAQRRAAANEKVFLEYYSKKESERELWFWQWWGFMIHRNRHIPSLHQAKHQGLRISCFYQSSIHSSLPSHSLWMRIDPIIVYSAGCQGLCPSLRYRTGHWRAADHRVDCVVGCWQTRTSLNF